MTLTPSNHHSHVTPIQTRQRIIAVPNRGDVNLPDPLKDRLQARGPAAQLAATAGICRSQHPQPALQYYLLDSSGFEPNVFTKIFSGINDDVQLTVTGANCGLPALGAVRLVLEPKPGLPTDATTPGLHRRLHRNLPFFVINNESGWYEGWMIHDLVVPQKRHRHAKTATRNSEC